MAEVIKVKGIGGMQMFLRGKLGDQVFQVKNGKQIVMQLPRKRMRQPSETELANQKRFKEVLAIYNTLTAEEIEKYAKARKDGGYTYNGKRYCTLRGYIFALNYEKYKKRTISIV